MTKLQYYGIIKFMITEDIELKFDSSSEEEKEINYLLEGVSKTQKERAQRVMAREEMQVVNRLLNYFKNKWKNKKTKQDYIKARQEANLLFDIINLYCKMTETNDPELKKYLYDVINITDQWAVAKSDNNTSSFVQTKRLPFISLSLEKDVSKINPADFKIPNDKLKPIEKNIRQLVALHEYGHLYEWLKEVIETGFHPEPKDTLKMAEAGKIKELKKLEGTANAYALDNMYRKDRRKILKNSTGYRNHNGEENKLTDLYITGTKENSKTLNKTLDSLDIEEANKSEELNSIVAYFKTIKEKFEKIGYKVPNVSFLVKRYAKNYSTFNPISSNKVNKIYIDIDAYKELASNKKALEYCLIDEIISIISNVNKVGDFVILSNWNKAYKENEVIPCSRIFLKKLLPNYYKKITLNESIFNY